MKRKDTRFDVVEISDRIDQAAETLRRLPPVRVRGYRSNWPTIIYSANEAYGWEPSKHVKSIPTGQEIDEMEEVVDWFLKIKKQSELTPYETKLIWWRAFGDKWDAIKYKTGYGETKLRADWKRAIIKTMLFVNFMGSNYMK
jgi:hypothetical protein